MQTKVHRQGLLNAGETDKRKHMSWIIIAKVVAKKRGRNGTTNYFADAKSSSTKKWRNVGEERKFANLWRCNLKRGKCVSARNKLEKSTPKLLHDQRKQRSM